MINKSKWIDNYRNLNPENQMEVALAIVNELKSQESSMDENLIKEILGFITNEKSLKDIKNILKRFEKLSEKNKNKAANEVFEIILKYIENQEQENNEAICKEKGHTFGKWKHNEWVKHIDTHIDGLYCKNYPVEQENWTRKCNTCGYVEKCEYEPQELIDSRNEKKKKARIKSLEKELKKLKDE